MAYGAEASSKQGKFFEMASALFADQENLAKTKDSKGFLAGKAKAIGLNVEQFKKDMDSDEAKNKIQKDLSQATDIGVNSTPTFFLNNNKVESPGTYDNFKKLIEDEISKK